MYPRILTIQDISCLGQCSLTVALPIISACGVETVILPSAVLSTHTGGFVGNTFRDLTNDIPNIAAHWKSEGVAFDGVYTGYLGSEKQIDYVLDIFNSFFKPGFVKIVDPAMADHGKLYKGFDTSFVKAMGRLISKADYILPNITEACLLTNTKWKPDFTLSEVYELITSLHKITDACVVLTGAPFSNDTTGVIVARKGETPFTYKHRRLSKGSHGTGDIFASVFSGALLKGFSAERASQIAADFTFGCIEKNADLKNHNYGVCFELCLPNLINMIYNI